MLATAFEVAGRRLLRVVAIGPEESLGGADESPRIRDAVDAGPRVHPLDEQDLGLVEAADAGEVALVEDGLADRPLGLAQQIPDRQLGIPIGAEEIGAEVTDQVNFLRP